jgi:crotonobetainyl-CoA:carnitine CoA-transferase CaiB-like acyl-CoA transferase
VLSPYRVLDLTDDRGELAGFMLASLGAEVIAVEPPEGSASRRRGPFAGGEPDPERSLTHWAYARGKRSVVLDLAASEADREAFRRLADGADVVIESSAPGAHDTLGIGYSALAGRNPALVYAAITPFGLTGPKAHWAASDLTVWASAGPLVLTGDDDRAPVRPGVPQAFAHASAEAAGAIVAALYERGRSGLGQLIDVSAQQACVQATQSMALATPNNTDVPTRGAGRIKLGPLDLQLLWPCADGYVSITFLFGTAIGPASARFMEWIHEAGYCDEVTRDKDWIAYTQLLMTGEEPISEYERVKLVIGEFCSAHTKQELLDGAMARRLLIAPVAMIDDVVGSPQLHDRGYWVESDGVRWPGPFAKLTATPLPVPSRPPRIGEHSAEVLESAGSRRPAGPPAAATAPTDRPLAGVKVLDLMWVMAGPAGTRVLADLGATIVRVESSKRIETARTLQPFRDSRIDTDTSALFANLNAGKLGFTLDPSVPDGRAVIADLVRWADVVTESFSPKALKGWGLDYDRLREINPSIVMLSSCLFGQTGPLAQFAGYGTMAAAMSGFFGITGWPDRPPCGPFGAYTDYISPRFATAALLAALDHRRRTGEGQYIDFAQAEGALHALAPALLEFTVNDHVMQRQGNHDPVFHPHGVFPCAGDDCWVAIACQDDAMRAALAGVIGRLDDHAIAAYTRQRTPDEVAAALQAMGVAAHALQNSPELLADPQLLHRRHFRTFPHDAMGEVVIEGPRFTMSRTPPDVAFPGPMLGQHTMEVLTELLGYPEDRIVELLGSGALE